MYVFTASEYFERFEAGLLHFDNSLKKGSLELERFKNGELHARVLSDVKGERCLILGTLAPPDENILRLCFLADALQNSGARSVDALLPYLGYGRQDKYDLTESSGIHLLGSWLSSSKIDKVFTFDVHSQLDLDLLGLPLISIPSTELFVPSIKSSVSGLYSVVAPDKGAIKRASELSSALGLKDPIAYFEKERSKEGVKVKLVGDVKKLVVIFDDILDTGKTLLAVCSELKKIGVSSIIIAVTHGLYSGEEWAELFALGVKQIICTDSTPESSRISPNIIRSVSLQPLINKLYEDMKGGRYE